MLVTGKSLFGFSHSNQLVAYQKLVPDEINITMIPNQAGGKPGQYLKPSMLLSIAETSGDKEAAAELMNFFITDPDANAILQIERGVSGDPAVREAILPGLSPTEKKIIDYLDVVATSVGPLPPPPPKNAGELDRALRPVWDSISFEKVSVEDGAKKYYDNAVAILGARLSAWRSRPRPRADGGRRPPSARGCGAGSGATPPATSSSRRGSSASSC